MPNAGYYTGVTKRAGALIAVGAVVAVAVAVAIGVTWLVGRPGASVGSTVNEAVTIECTGATGVTGDRCRAWGDAVLAEDAAPRTFEREDLRRLRLDRSALGLGNECRAEWFLSRYADSAVWADEVACR